MTDSYWQTKWREGDIGFNQAEPHPQLRQHFQAAPGSRVLVPLCGKSVDLLWLHAQGCLVTGIELSELACEAFFAENGLTARRHADSAGMVRYVGEGRAQGIDLWCGDFFQVPASAWDGVDALYDRAAMVALPPAVRREYVARIIERLGHRPGVRILLITVDYPEGLLAGPPFSVPESEVRTGYGERFRIERVSRTIDPRLTERGGGSAVFESTYLLEVR